MKKIIANHKIITITILLLIAIFVTFTTYFCTSKQDKIDDITLIKPNGGEEIMKGSSVEIRWASSNIPSSDTNETNISLGLDANTVAYNTKNYGLQLDSANYILSDFGNNIFRVDPLFNLPYKIDGGVNSTVNSSFSNDLGISLIISNIGYVFKPSSKISVVKAQCISEGACDSACGTACQGAATEIANGLIIAGLIVVGIAVVAVGIGLIIWAATRESRKELVNIDLFKGGIPLIRIAEKFPNIGLFNWIVPIDIPDGEDYFIRVSNSKRAEISDDSNSTFSIIAKKGTDNANDDGNSTNNNDDTNSNPDNDDAIISEAQNKILPFYKPDHIEKISINQLPDGMPHSVYVNFDKVSDEVGNMPSNKVKLLDRVFNNAFMKNKPKNLSPLEDSFVDYFAEQTMKENLEMFDDVKEIVMGIGLLKYGSKPAMASLLRVNDAENIRNRMEENKEYYSRHKIEGLDVYKSVSTSTIIFSNQVIGITNRGIEKLLIKSYLTNVASDTPELNRDIDLFWTTLDVKGLGYVVDELKFDKMGININELDKISFKISKYDDRYSLSVDIKAKNPLIAHKYTPILNKLLSEMKETYARTAFIGLSNDNESYTMALLNSLIFKNDGNSIFIDADIYNTMIDKAVNQ